MHSLMRDSEVSHCGNTWKITCMRLIDAKLPEFESPMAQSSFARGPSRGSFWPGGLAAGETRRGPLGARSLSELFTGIIECSTVGFSMHAETQSVSARLTSISRNHPPACKKKIACVRR